MPLPQDGQGKDTKNDKQSLIKHRADVAGLKAQLSAAADISCKELLIPLNRETQLPIRIYRPKSDTRGPLPTFFYVPGTGFVAWETSFTDVICSHIAEKAHCQVIAIYHRLAPENKFPAGYKDAYRIMKALLQASSRAFEIDHHNVGLGGYSSGANLAALMAIQSMKAKLPIRYQALVSPIIDLSRSLRVSEKYKHLKEFEDRDQAITEEFTRWVLDLYLPEDINRKEPYISPFWQDNKRIRELPPTDIIYGEFDRTRIDSTAWEEKLKSENVPVASFMFDKEDHSLIWHRIEVIETIAQRLKQVFGTEPIPRSLADKHRMITIKLEYKQEKNESSSVRARL